MAKHRPHSKTNSLYHLSMNFSYSLPIQTNLIWKLMHVWGGTTNLFKQTKQTKTKNEKKAIQEQHNCAWNNKNEVFWKKTWDFYWWRRGCLGHPQALMLVLLGYFLRWHAWHPQAWALVHPSSHYSFLPYTWNFSFIQNFTQSLLATLVHSR